MIIDDGLVVVVGKIMVWEKINFIFHVFTRFPKNSYPNFKMMLSSITQNDGKCEKE